MSILFGSHAAPNERELRGYRWFQSGVQPFVIGLPQDGVVITKQEQPPYQSAFVISGVEPNTIPPWNGTVIVRQEQPGHPLPSEFPSLFPPIVFSNPIEGRETLNIQEQPRHPGPFLTNSIKFPDVFIPALMQAVSVRQEQPPPLPSQTTIAPFPTRYFLPPANWLLGRQEMPVQSISFLGSSSVLPQNFIPPSAQPQLGVTRQEQPPYFAPILGISIQDIQKEARSFTMVTEQPSSGQPSFFGAGPPPIVVVPTFSPFGAAAVTVREQPGHPPPSFDSGMRPYFNRPPVINQILVRQEQPGNPPPTFGSPLLPNFKVTFADIIVLRQEQPGHPLPQLDHKLPPQLPFLGARSIGVTQALPGHPLPYLLAGPSPVAFYIPLSRQDVIVPRYQPDHPLPRFWSSNPVNPPPPPSPPLFPPPVPTQPPWGGYNQPWPPPPPHQFPEPSQTAPNIFLCDLSQYLGTGQKVVGIIAVNYFSRIGSRIVQPINVAPATIVGGTGVAVPVIPGITMVEIQVVLSDGTIMSCVEFLG